MLPELVMMHVRYSTGAGEAIRPDRPKPVARPAVSFTHIAAAWSPARVTRLVSRTVRRYFSSLESGRRRVRRDIADEPTLIIGG